VVAALVGAVYQKLFSYDEGSHTLHGVDLMIVIFNTVTVRSPH